MTSSLLCTIKLCDYYIVHPFYTILINVAILNLQDFSFTCVQSTIVLCDYCTKTDIIEFEYHDISLSSWHQHCAEGPRLHHREVGGTAVHTVKHEAMYGGSVCKWRCVHTGMRREGII